MFTSFGTELWEELWDIHEAHSLSNIFAVYRFLIGPATSFASSFGIELWHRASSFGTSTKLTVNLGTLTKPTTIRLFLLIIESR